MMAARRALLLVLLVIPMVAGATQTNPDRPAWHQAGGGEGHAGVALLGPGPFDVLTTFSLPITTKSSAFLGVAETASGLVGISNGPTHCHVFAVQLDDVREPRSLGDCPVPPVYDVATTAESETLVHDGAGIVGYVPSRQNVILAYPGKEGAVILEARHVVTGRTAWDLTTAPFQLDASPTPELALRVHAAALDLSGDSMVVAVGVTRGAATGADGALTVAQVGLEDGEVQWIRKLKASDVPASGFERGALPGTATIRVGGITLTPTGIVMTVGAYAQGALVWWDRDGNHVSSHLAEETQPILDGTSSTALYASAGDYAGIGDWAAAFGRVAAVQFGSRLVLINPTTNAYEASVALDPDEGIQGYLAWPAPKWWLSSIVVPLTTTVMRFDAAGLQKAWTWTDSLASSVADILLVAPGDAYVLTARNTTTPGDRPEVAFSRLDVSSGMPLQRIPLPMDPIIVPEEPSALSATGPSGRDGTRTPRWNGHLLPLADGDRIVVWSGHGQGVILGTAPTAIQPGVTLSSAYPARGEAITLHADVGGEPPERLLVAWGDGTLEEAAYGESLLHQYAQDGRTSALVTALFADGRTATTVVSVDVGGVAPTSQTFLQEQFSAQNQERTFFLLGLLITALIAFVGATRVRRRRSLLQRELDAIEAVYARSRSNPVSAEAALAERRAHVRGLLADGRLDAAEAGVLERRIDELGASGRLETLEERFGFLSVGMARALRGMLADGRIQGWEREHFMLALDKDKYLTKRQKATVRSQVESWFRQDRRAQP